MRLFINLHKNKEIKVNFKSMGNKKSLKLFVKGGEDEKQN